MTKEMTYSMEELYPVWMKLAARYTGADSTSLPWEKAQTLMGAVLYCLQESGTEPSALARAGGGGLSLAGRYETGRRLVREKAQRLRDLYHELLSDFEDYGVPCLRETITEGLPAFFLHYDMEFAPQNTLLLMDYPLLCGPVEGSGVDAVWEYTKGIFMEQQFLGGFDKGYLSAVLRAYSRGFGRPAENICGIVIPCLAGHVILKTPVQEGFSAEDRVRLAGYLSGYDRESLSMLLEAILDGFCEERCAAEEELRRYLRKGAAAIAVRIYQCAENHCLERVFPL